MDLSKCGGVCKGACRHYEIGVECPAETTYEPWPLDKCPTCAHINCHSSTCPDNPDKFCEWVPEDKDSNWYSSQCGYSFCFEDGGADHNGFKFCPKCGKKLKEIPWDNSRMMQSNLTD